VATEFVDGLLEEREWAARLVKVAAKLYSPTAVDNWLVCAGHGSGWGRDMPPGTPGGGGGCIRIAYGVRCKRMSRRGTRVAQESEGFHAQRSADRQGGSVESRAGV
jgi:hypothetical protein